MNEGVSRSCVIVVFLIIYRVHRCVVSINHDNQLHIIDV